MRNLFCDQEDLHNETDVEQNFARRFIESLGYSDSAIRPRDALERLTVGNVGDDRLHRPDFAIKSGGHIRWILEAKSPGEQLDRHFDQANGYCEAINNSYSQMKPVQWFVLTNAMETRLYYPGNPQAQLTLRFSDFSNDNNLYQSFIGLLRPQMFPSEAPVVLASDVIRFTKPSIPEVNRVFAKCHQHIHQSGNISQAAGFMEFVKLISLKLLSDRHIKENCPGIFAERTFDYPADEVTFSLHWLKIHESADANPVNSILFKNFIEDVERDIATRVRKRFFDADEQIKLKPETVRWVVERLQHLFLFGVDADLNGRLFEHFLSATMRGKDLGQYFTPRTLVKLGVGLGDLKTSDYVLDGCCGTGGFLIDSLADMWAKVNANASLSETAKSVQLREIADKQIYGVDFAKDPNLAKIARLNMYLHGDGGSRIFNVDSLDLDFRSDDTIDSPEEVAERREMRELELTGSFDVVLTNPPFSKKYERSKAGDALVLDQYTVSKGKTSLLAKIMFFETYHHYLKPGGRLVSVIDDGFLNGNSHRWFRDILRSLYAIKAVVSLPGDAFQRSEARVKTSLVVLEKRDPAVPKEQPSIFMYACRYVGIDDPKRSRWMPGDDEMRANALQEVATVIREYKRFLAGHGNPEFIVPSVRAGNRLDVKHCLIDKNWRGSTSPLILSDVVEVKTFPESDIIDCGLHEDPVQLFTVRYDGSPSPGRIILPRTETDYQQLFRVQEGDIVISNIAASYGSVAIVPNHLDGSVVSKEYTVLVPKDGFDRRVIWAIFRSPELRAEMLVRTTGANRTRIAWTAIQDIAFPYPDLEMVEVFVRRLQTADDALSLARREQDAAFAELNDVLGLGMDNAHHILDAFKPPR